MKYNTLIEYVENIIKIGEKNYSLEKGKENYQRFLNINGEVFRFSLLSDSISINKKKTNEDGIVYYKFIFSSDDVDFENELKFNDYAKEYLFPEIDKMINSYNLKNDLQNLLKVNQTQTTPSIKKKVKI